MADDQTDKQARPGEWRDVLAPEVMERYIGKHIAIIHKRIVAAGDTYEFVREEAQKLYPDETPYLAFIPPATPAGQSTPDAAPSSVEIGEQGATGGSARTKRLRHRS